MSSPLWDNESVDRYEGVTVALKSSMDSPERFEEALKCDLNRWQSMNRRGVWVTVQASQSDCIPVLIRHGFEFHHVNEGSPSSLTLTKWLPVKIPNTLPHWTTHYVGVGGLVFHPTDKSKCLLISESVDLPRVRWKLPGGLVDKGEMIADAAVREVFEETGIRAVVRSVLLSRERTDAIFGASDIYYVVVMDAQHADINMCQSELAFARWWDVKEFVQSPDFNDTYPANRSIFEIASQIVSSGGNSESMPVLPVPCHWNTNIHHIVVGHSYVPLVRKYLPEVKHLL